MKLFPLRKTDSEYIETLRKQYKIRWFSFGIALFFAILLIIIFYWGGLYLETKNKAFLKTISELPKSTGDNIKHVNSAISSFFSYKIGLLVGFGMTVGVWCLIICIIVAKSWRKDALLLKYYDETLKDKRQ